MNKKINQDFEIKTIKIQGHHLGLVLGFCTGENGKTLQYSCLANRMDRGACRAMVHGVAESWTQLK